MIRRWMGWGACLLVVLCGAVGGSAAQAASPLRITEIYYDTPGRDENEEWIEIANLGDDPVPLGDVKVGDEEAMGNREGMARFPADAAITPGQVIVVAQTAGGFRALFGANPDYEIRDTDPAVADMRPYPLWGTGDFALANDGDEVLLVGPDNVIVDAVNYGDSGTFFTPAVAGVLTGQSIERAPAGCDTDTAADWQPQPTPTPGTITQEGDCHAPPDPTEGLDLLPIGAIQGAGDVSPYVNETVTFRGTVTGAYADRNTRGITFYTLFVQNAPDDADGDPATSDAIAVFLGRERPRYELGDEVLVSGRVTEFFGFTEIDDAGLEIQGVGEGAPLPDPVTLAPPQPYEAVEAMRATLPDARVVGPTFSGCGFSVVPAGGDVERVLRRTESDPIAAILPILHTTDVNCAGFPQVKVGDGVAGLTGPLIYHFDQFKIVQQDAAALALTPAPLPDPLPPPTLAPDQFTVASFNLENYFDTVDDTGDDAEPKPTAEELAVQRAKLARTIALAGCPTLLGVQEVENAALLQDLAAELADPCAFTYAVTHRESVDARGIDVALLSDPGRVTVESAQLRQTCTTIDTGIANPADLCGLAAHPLFSRPPLQVDVAVDGERLTLVVNHFKSKRGGAAETAPRRLEQAAHVNALVEERLAADAGARVVVMGDFNDYDRSPPLLAMAADGPLVNVLEQVPEPDRYSFVFGGASQLIDGLLVTPAVLEQVVAVDILHVNADYPAGWATDLATPYRSSDHDLPLLVLQSPAEEAPPPTAAPTPRPTATPERVVEEDPAGDFPLWPALALGAVVVLGGGWLLLRRE